MARYTKSYNDAGEWDSVIDENGNWFPRAAVSEEGNEFVEVSVIQQQEEPGPVNDGSDLPPWAT